MAEFYLLPSVSPTMEFGVLAAWHLDEGAVFESGAVIAEIGTDKATMDAEVFDDGVLLKQLVSEGDEVPLGFPIAIIGESGDDIAALLSEFKARKAEADASVDAAIPDAAQTDGEPEPSPPAASETPTRAAPVTSPIPVAKARNWMGTVLPTTFMDPPGDIRVADVSARVVASPLARKLAADMGLNLQRVSGSGPRGRIVGADVQSARGSGEAKPVPADEVIKHSMMRRTIAKRLLASHQDIPTFFLTVEFDAAGLVETRKQLKAAYPDRKASYNDLVILAVARSLREFPAANAAWGDKAITRRGRVDIGVAVALDEGLITPVVRNADAKSVFDIGLEVRELAGRAKAGKLDPSEYTGATLTISNLGMMGIEQFTAIINPPEAAILAVGGLNQVPVVQDGQLTVGWRMKATMTCDHRVLDGSVGAGFLQVLRRYIEAPFLLFVD